MAFRVCEFDHAEGLTWHEVIICEVGGLSLLHLNKGCPKNYDDK